MPETRKINQPSLYGIKDPFTEINYGSGKSVSEETMEDAQKPLAIKWHSDRYGDSCEKIRLNRHIFNRINGNRICTQQSVLKSIQSFYKLV